MVLGSNLSSVKDFFAATLSLIRLLSIYAFVFHAYEVLVHVAQLVCCISGRRMVVKLFIIKELFLSH